MIKSFSLAAMAVLVLAGCNSGGSDNSSKSLSDYSEAEKLAYVIANQNTVLDSVSSDNNTRSTRSTKSRTVASCDSGTMEVFFSVPFDQVSYDSEPNKILFNDCKIGNETTNGDIKLDVSTDGLTETMSTENGFTVSGGEYPGSILKGGTMTRTQDGDWEILTINLEMQINGIKHGGENLIYRGRDFDDGSSIEYPVSGKEKIGNSAYFTVDPAYDASSTPFKTNADGKLVSGKFKYLDKQNHAVELEITGEDVVTVRVDEDGNGSFVGDEVSSIDLD